MLSNKANLISLLILLSALFIVANKFLWANEKTSTTSSSDDELPRDFLTFYHNFHQDSLYQIDHILFPLQGQRSDSLGQNNSYAWSDTTWKLHHPISFLGTTYEQVFQIAPGFITDIVYSEKYNLSMIRRFVRTSNSYQLVFYKEMGPVIESSSGGE